MSHPNKVEIPALISNFFASTTNFRFEMYKVSQLLAYCIWFQCVKAVYNITIIYCFYLCFFYIIVLHKAVMDSNSTSIHFRGYERPEKPVPGDCGYHLHAHRAVFSHPATNEVVKFTQIERKKKKKKASSLLGSFSVNTYIFRFSCNWSFCMDRCSSIQHFSHDA